MSLADSTDFDIRYSTPEDVSDLRKWLSTEGIEHWFPFSDEKEREDFIRVWMGFCRFKATLTATIKGELVGMAVLYLMPYRKVAHQCMFQIVVDPKHQGLGVGRSLVKNLKHLAQSRFHIELMHVEILDTNPMIPLLESLGFTEVCRQQRYVKEGEQYFPRILMECELT